MSIQRLLNLAIVGFLSAVLLGCGNPGDGKTVVQGTATWNGHPIERGYVEVSPTSGPGQVDGADIVDGKFSLRTTTGEKRVSVVAQRKIGETPPSERIPHPEPIYFQFLPQQFNDNTTLNLTIEASNPTVTLDLTGEERSQAELANGRPR